MNAELRTHLIPFILAALVTPVVVATCLAGDTTPPIWWPDLAVYLVLGLTLFGASSLYHTAVGTPLEETLNKVDHWGIHLLIAGTGTVHMKVLPAVLESRVPMMLGIVWALAIGGVLYRVALGDRVRKPLVMVVYGAMAVTVLPTIDWNGDLSAPPMLATYGALAMYAFAAGVLFPRKHLHAWWHIGTVAGYVLAGPHARALGGRRGALRRGLGQDPRSRGALRSFLGARHDRRGPRSASPVLRGTGQGHLVRGPASHDRCRGRGGAAE